MILELKTKLSSFFKDKSEEIKILVVFRFVSLIVTSVFYLIVHSQHGFAKKIIILCSLFIASIILSYLYSIYEKSSRNIIVLLAIEIAGNIALMIPSGGIKSPFIWYTLNTALISSIFLKKKYYWANFIIYFTYFLGNLLFHNFLSGQNADILQVVKDESNLLLSFIMIIIAILAWAIVIKRTKEDNKKLEEINMRLEIANDLLTESINHSKELYQSVNILTNQGNREGILSISFEHIKRITGAGSVFFYDMTNGSDRVICTGCNNIVESIKESICKESDSILKTGEIMEIDIRDLKFLIISIDSVYSTYGILGLEITAGKNNIAYADDAEQLQFLSELLSSAFERLEIEEISHRLVVTEEQNRIANEIHDSILQRLFSMSCGMFSLIKRLNDCTYDEILQELNLFRNNTDSITKELKEKIYGLSWKKSGASSFGLDIKRYIEDIKRLNKVNIPFSIIGNIEHISTAKKKALYRIICEGVGNAVRHGKAKNIDVVLQITASDTNLKIIDNGTGFNLKSGGDVMRGLGIKNLYQLVERFQGDIKIESKLGQGTAIEIMIPNILKREEAQ